MTTMNPLKRRHNEAGSTKESFRGKPFSKKPRVSGLKKSLDGASKRSNLDFRNCTSMDIIESLEREFSKSLASLKQEVAVINREKAKANARSYEIEAALNRALGRNESLLSELDTARVELAELSDQRQEETAVALYTNPQYIITALRSFLPREHLPEDAVTAIAEYAASFDLARYFQDHGMWPDAKGRPYFEWYPETGDLAFNSFSTDKIPQLAIALSLGMEEVMHLSLDATCGPTVASQLAVELAAILPRSGLVYLNLSSLGLDVQGIIAILEACKSTKCCLEILDLSNNPQIGLIVKDVVKALSKKSSLKELRLWHNSLSKDAKEVLTEAAKKSSIAVEL